MKPVSGRDFAKVLEKNGWVLRRVHGSHHIYGKERISVRISVPIHGNKLLKAGLQGHLAKLAGLKVEDFN